MNKIYAGDRTIDGIVVTVDGAPARYARGRLCRYPAVETAEATE